MQTKSSMEGWVKTARGIYRNEAAKVEVRKNSKQWEVVGGENDGFAYGALWSAMYAAAKTQAVLVRR